MDLRRIELAGREFEQNADDFILGVAQPLRAAPAVAVLEQKLVGAGARLRQRRLQAAGDRRAQLALSAGIALRQRVQICDDRRTVEKFARVARGAVNFKHRASVINEAPPAVIARRGLRPGVGRPDAYMLGSY